MDTNCRWSRLRVSPFPKFLTLIELFLVCILAVARLCAQVENGIAGTVTDSSGAAIANASVTVVNASTRVSVHTTTTSVGTYKVIGLVPGYYSVEVEAQGFSKSVQSGVIVEVAKTSTADVRLVPGSTSATVKVTASAISLNTESPAIGTTLEPELVNTAPIEINGLARQLDSFMYLAPGVQGNASSHNINGGLTFENEVQFNDVPVAFVQYQGNQTYINPPYEMVNEFRVNSSTFEASYGLGQGAVTYSMTSGTNLLHADGFYILRNQLFDSDGFFPTYFRGDGHPAPPINQQNDLGFTVSGPVILPHLYKGKDRTFFLVSADWFRQNQAQKAIGTVPTPAMKQGDFSNFVDSNGAQIAIYDPQTGQPFPDNIIPPSRISPLAQTVLPSIPDPDRPGVVFGQQANKSPAVSSLAVSQDLWGFTLDHNITRAQAIHFSMWRDSISSPFFTFAPIVPPTSELQSEIHDTELGTGILLNYVYTIKPNLMMTLGADWIGEISGLHNAKLGVSFPGLVNGVTFPYIGFDGQNTPTSFGASNGLTNVSGQFGGFAETNNRQLGIVFANNWIWTKGRHAFNMGGQFRRTYQDLYACQFCGGTFSFTQRTTSTPDTNDPNFGTYGSSFASFLLGQVDAAVRLSSNVTRMRNKEFALYFQDDIKVSQRLTANLGLRWDIMVPFTEEHDNAVYVNFQEPTVLDPAAGNLPGGATKFGDCDGCAGIRRADIAWKNFQPRVGLSYRLTPKTVIQSGFFLTFLNGGAYEYGSTQTAFYFASLLGGQFSRQSSSGHTPAYGSWDNNPMPDPPPTPFSPSIGNGTTILGFNPKTFGRAPYDSAWNLSVQRQLPWNMFLTVAYVGNRAIHVPSSLHQPEQPHPDILHYGSLLGELATSQDAVNAGITIPFPGWVDLFGGTGTVIQTLLPFPQYSDIYNTYETDGTAFYNGLQIQGEKRFSNGLSFLADFTLSRNIANESVGSTLFQPNPINSFNMPPEFTPSALDQKYITNIVATYALPFGSGQRFVNRTGFINQIVGGWKLSGVLSYNGGYPFGAFNGYNPLYANFGDRPDIVPGVKLKTYSYSRSKDFFTGKLPSQPTQFPTNAFVNTGPWALGNSVRSYASLRTPPLRLENFDAIKTFPIEGRVRLSLRLDYFNAFNRTQLQAPDGNSVDSTFGQITNLSSQISNRQGEATFRIEF
jgi:Carboxypeptidase regulatory-like domain/TonB dependent receptor